MFRLHSFMGNTYENAMAFMYGMHVDNITNSNVTDFKAPFTEKIEPIWTHLKEQGFITGYTSNVCEAGIFG